MTPQEARARLVALGAVIVSRPEFQERDGKTYCNFATNEFAKAYGCLELSNKSGDPLMANDMVDYMSESNSFKSIGPLAAQAHADRGEFVIACVKESGHGHVATVSPLPMVFSGKWNDWCPQLYNVGKSQYTAKTAPWTMGANFAFKDKPLYFLYTKFSTATDLK